MAESLDTAFAEITERLEFSCQESVKEGKKRLGIAKIAGAVVVLAGIVSWMFVTIESLIGLPRK